MKRNKHIGASADDAVITFLKRVITTLPDASTWRIVKDSSTGFYNLKSQAHPNSFILKNDGNLYQLLATHTGNTTLYNVDLFIADAYNKAQDGSTGYATQSTTYLTPYTQVTTAIPTPLSYSHYPPQVLDSGEGAPNNFGAVDYYTFPPTPVTSGSGGGNGTGANPHSTATTGTIHPTGTGTSGQGADIPPTCYMVDGVCVAPITSNSKYVVIGLGLLALFFILKK